MVHLRDGGGELVEDGADGLAPPHGESYTLTRQDRHLHSLLTNPHLDKAGEPRSYI